MKNADGTNPLRRQFTMAVTAEEYIQASKITCNEELLLEAVRQFTLYGGTQKILETLQKAWQKTADYCTSESLPNEEKQANTIASILFQARKMIDEA
jgi:hypothetical protein